MDNTKLVELLEILSKYGVLEYKSAGIELKLDLARNQVEPPSSFKIPVSNDKLEQSQLPTDEDFLFYSSDQGYIAPNSSK